MDVYLNRGCLRGGVGRDGDVSFVRHVSKARIFNGIHFRFREKKEKFLLAFIPRENT